MDTKKPGTRSCSSRKLARAEACRRIKEVSGGYEQCHHRDKKNGGGYETKKDE